MDQKICLITGANSGIGKVTASKLAEDGMLVIMLCRNREKGQKAKEDIIAKTGKDNIDLIIADLSSQSQVKKAAEEFYTKYHRLDILINNAGLILGNERQVSEDNIELTLAINHLSHFLLTYLLWNALQKSPEARIINVTSEAHRIVNFDPENIQMTTGYSGLKAYGVSKLCNLLFTYELNKRNREPNISVNAMHPGGVASNFGKNISGWFKWAFKLFKPFMISPEKGAETLIYLAKSDEGRQKSGKYFKDKKVTEPTKIAQNDEMALKTWELSENLTGIKFPETVTK